MAIEALRVSSEVAATFIMRCVTILRTGFGIERNCRRTKVSDERARRMKLDTHEAIIESHVQRSCCWIQTVCIRSSNRLHERLRRRGRARNVEWSFLA